MAIQGTNLHTRVFSALVRAEFASFRRLTAEDLKPEAAHQHVPSLVHPVLGHEIVRNDYELEGRSTLKRSIIRLIHELLPLSEPAATWSSPEQARSALEAEFSDRLRARVQWPAPSDAWVTGAMATNGFAAHLLEAAPGGGYCVDLIDMASYEVRPGFQRYGARLVLDRDLQVEGIDWQGARVRPGDGAWSRASLVFRSSVAAAVTIRDHAMKCHMIGSNAFLLATRRHLPPRHPVRQLLAPFQFRTAIINRGALLTLIGERAIFHRLWAFTWDSLVRYYRAAQASFRMETLPAELARRGVASLDGHAYAEDGLALWSCLERYVDRFLGRHIGAGPLHDPALLAWWVCIRKLCGHALPCATRDDLVQLCTWLLFLATAYHAQVGGSIADNLQNLAMAPASVRAGRTLEEMLPTRDTYARSYMLGVLTTLPVPKLMEDFSWLYPEQADRDAVHALHADLAALAGEIDARNARRRIPFFSAHPRHLELSVSL